MPYWVVARTALNHERLAWESVGARGFETFIPRIRVKAGPQWKTTPLFGVYFFIRVVDQWRILERTMGVLNVVKTGETPSRCPHEEIAKLIARSDRDGIVRLGARPSSSSRYEFASGAKVTVVGGPLFGLSALHTGMSTGDRELVLLNVLGGPRKIAIASHLIVPQQRI